jgi:DNA-binding response OmpR family regulator
VAAGYIVSSASSCEAGLAEAAIRPPDAVLLDLHMPLADGLECLRRMRGAPLHLMMPVAILTGDYFLDDDIARQLQELGARIHFKPVWDGDLDQIVAGLMSQSAGRLP